MSTQIVADQTTRTGSRVVSGWQSEVENPLEHQEGTDGLVSVMLATAPPPVMVVVNQLLMASASTQKVSEPRLIKDLLY